MNGLQKEIGCNLSDEIMTYTVYVKDSLTNASIIVPDGIYQFPSAWSSFKNVFFNTPNGTERRTIKKNL